MYEKRAMDEHKRKKIACNKVDALVRKAKKTKLHVVVKETGLHACVSFCSGLVKSQCPGCLDKQEHAYYFPPHCIECGAKFGEIIAKRMCDCFTGFTCKRLVVLILSTPACWLVLENAH